MKEIVVVSQDPYVTNLADRLLSPHFRLHLLAEMVSAVDLVFNRIPDLMVADMTSGGEGALAALCDLKEDPIFSQLPVLAVVADEAAPSWERLPVEDYVRKGDVGRDLLARANLALSRAARIVEINPLTRLPGNISINRQIEERLGRGDVFAFAYADLDNFKPFNDKYGFSRGDEVIRITGRLILNIVKSVQPSGSFVGHIGGDDFVFLMDVPLVEGACREIIRVFDGLIPTLYDARDRERKGIEAPSRQGDVRFFPLMGISIGVTDTAGRGFSHFGELTGAASEMKSFAKKTKGSFYSIDRRLRP